jgi:cell wall-associated NlpC family hydrolase
MIDNRTTPTGPRRSRRMVVGAAAGLLAAPFAAVADRGARALAAPEVEAAGAKGGKKIAREALRHKGERYTWGGNNPRQGFDCSGFTQYVVQKATGQNLSQALPDQWRAGRKVGKGKWRAGDLVFFENTYKRGLSHVGIYLGKGRFIHAQNEQTGVVVTDIDAEYYAKRYLGARRVA